VGLSSPSATAHQKYIVQLQHSLTRIDVSIFTLQPATYTLHPNKMQFTNPDNNIRELELKGDETLVIFGSGAGGHTFAALRVLGGSGRVVAIDPRQQLLDRVQSEVDRMKLSGFTAKCADYEHANGTGLQQQYADVVMVPNTLFSASRKDTLLKEAHRVLKYSGRLLLVEWKDSYGGMGPQPEHVVREDTARSLIETAGLMIERTYAAGAQHYGIVARKQAPNR